MTNWQQIAEELREAARHLDRAKSKLSRFGWEHIRRKWDRCRDEMLEFADWAAEKADMFATNKGEAE